MAVVVWPKALPSLQCRDGEGDATNTTVKVVEPSSKDTAQIQKHICPVYSFRAAKHVQLQHLLQYLPSLWDHHVADLVL